MSLFRDLTGKSTPPIPEVPSTQVSTEAKLLLLETRLSSQIAALHDCMEEHIRKEESMFKVRLNQEEEQSKATDVLLNEIKNDISSIEVRLRQQDQDHKLAALEERNSIDKAMKNTYVTKEDIERNISSLKSQAKLVWYTIIVIASGLAWLIQTYVNATVG